MTYGTCPRCGIRIGVRSGVGPSQCPRCLIRKGASIDLVRSFQQKTAPAEHGRRSRAH